MMLLIVKIWEEDQEEVVNSVRELKKPSQKRSQDKAGP